MVDEIIRRPVDEQEMNREFTTRMRRLVSRHRRSSRQSKMRIINGFVDCVAGNNLNVQVAWRNALERVFDV